jgi:hypothetical protein
MYGSIYRVYKHANNYLIDGLKFDKELVHTCNVDEGYLTMTEAENEVRDELETRNDYYIHMLLNFVL